MPWLSNTMWECPRCRHAVNDVEQGEFVPDDECREQVAGARCGCWCADGYGDELRAQVAPHGFYNHDIDAFVWNDIYVDHVECRDCEGYYPDHKKDCEWGELLLLVTEAALLPPNLEQMGTPTDDTDRVRFTPDGHGGYRVEAL